MQYDIKYILNLNPSDVKSFSQQVINDHITYYITLNQKIFFCPVCHSKIYIKDYSAKEIHHQIIRDKNTKIIYRQRRYYCKTCNKTFYEDNPLSYGAYSLPTILAVLRFLKEQSSTFAMASRLFNIPAPSIVNLFDTFVNVPRKNLPEILMIDEFYAFRKQTKDKKYCCLLMDFSTGEVIDIIEGRTKLAWQRYLQKHHKINKKDVKIISIDMFEAYRQVQKDYFPDAILAVDSFHVVKNINRLVFLQRNRIMRTCEKGSDNYYLLKKFRWLLMLNGYSPKLDVNRERKYNKKLNRFYNYYELLNLILDIDDTLTEAYTLKESYLYFNSHTTYENANEELNEIIIEFAESSIDLFRNFTGTLVNWHDEIINSFIIRDGKRISNGKIESTNSIIKTILKSANGYTNFKRLRNKILYVLDKELELTLIKNKFGIKNKGKERGKYNKQ